jgi:hypothetical protein
VWSSPVSLYPVHMSPVLVPLGQSMVIEPQVSIREVDERYSVMNIIGIEAYQQRPISTMHWVARC